MSKLFPNKNQWKRWSLPSKLGAMGAYIAILLAPFTIWSFFTPNSIVYNIYNNTKKEVINEKTKEDKDYEKEHQISKIIEPTIYSLIGNNNSSLINEIEKQKKIRIGNDTSNKIEFSISGDIFVYGDVSNNIYKSRKGRLIISVNNCMKVCDDLIIPSFGPAPKSIIQQEINSEIEKIIGQNIKLIAEKINKCLD